VAEVAISQNKPPGEETMGASLVRTAVYESDPSLNQDFIEPALKAFGYRKVQEALLAYLEQGTPHLGDRR
jgi:hypothetical protein